MIDGTIFTCIILDLTTLSSIRCSCQVDVNKTQLVVPSGCVGISVVHVRCRQHNIYFSRPKLTDEFEFSVDPTITTSRGVIETS